MKIKKSIFNITKKHLILLSVLSGIFYNSWILGYFLNKNQVKNAYYSVLESPDKPHYLLYVSLDLISGLLVFLIGLFLNTKIKNDHRVIRYYLTFGALIVLDAIYPISDKCATTIEACGVSLSQILTYHDILGILEFTIIFLILKNLKRIANSKKIINYIKPIRYTFLGYLISLILMIISVPMDFMTGLTQGIVIIFTALAIILTPLVLAQDI